MTKPTEITAPFDAAAVDAAEAADATYAEAFYVPAYRAWATAAEAAGVDVEESSFDGHTVVGDFDDESDRHCAVALVGGRWYRVELTADRTAVTAVEVSE